MQVYKPDADKLGEKEIQNPALSQDEGMSVNGKTVKREAGIICPLESRAGKCVCLTGAV